MKVGDKVRVLGTTHGAEFKLGTVGVITGGNYSPKFRVDALGTYLYYNEDELELVESGFKVGDKVRIFGKERTGEVLSKETEVWGDFYKIKVKDGGVEFLWPFQIELKTENFKGRTICPNCHTNHEV